MLKILKSSIFFISILTLIFQGCGESNSSSTYPTTLGDSTSIGTSDEGAVVSPSTNTVKSITQEVSTILTTDITSLNTKTAVAFIKETNYCDISGLIESQHSGDFTKISSTQNYENCQEEKSLQHGILTIDYTQMNLEGKYPNNLYLTVKEDYSLNNMKLKKNLTIESSILYNDDKSIKQIILKINGELNLDSVNYVLQNITETINY
jgi:hypothetical protein